MTGEKYLGQIGLTPKRFMPHKVNVIKCPCGAGKTHFAFKNLPKFTHSNHCILYLTDTNMTRDQIISNEDYEAVGYDPSWRYFMNLHSKESILHNTVKWRKGWGTYRVTRAKLTKITVMNYAKVGAILHYADQPFDWSKFDYVVCDEMHNLINFQNINVKDKSTGKTEAVNILKETVKKIEETLANYPNVKIIALTATPQKVEANFDTHPVLTEQEYNSLYRYDTDHELFYRDPFKQFNLIPVGGKGIVYFNTIGSLKDAEAYLNKLGHKTASLWSLSNTDHPMTADQKKVRKYIVKKQRIPSYVDILLFNSACETGINIKNDDIGFMMIHSEDAETQEQVRGRNRNDLKIQLSYLASLPDLPCPVPESFLNRPLTVDDKKALCNDYVRYLKPNKAEPYQWHTDFKNYLTNLNQYNDDNFYQYKIIDKTIKNQRVSIIEQIPLQNK